ncbi:hypothetical protein AB0E67_17250 [Streptomyces sp. NPDC032161]|uniref:hypothetical protein n=1 Tax=unclassified Streptomyces TaxID=2593676 RepID=UPI0033C1F5E6
MADASPQGRLAVAKALRELTAFGYYRVHKVRREDGTFVSEAHVYDTPQQSVAGSGSGLACQVVPGVNRPGSGGPTAGGAGANPVKNRRKEPSLPGRRRSRRRRQGTGEPSEAPAASMPPTVPEASAGKDVLTAGEVFGTGAGAGAGVGVGVRAGEARGSVDPFVTEAHGAAVATLYQVIGPEKRLRLGAVEALALAPLVSAWLERGYDQRDLAGALLSGLPARIHSASAILRDRLTRKLPPPPEPSFPGYAMPEPPPGSGLPRWAECDECRRPVPESGLCRDCAAPADGPGHPRPDDDTTIHARTAARGRALVRAALGEDG